MGGKVWSSKSHYAIVGHWCIWFWLLFDVCVFVFVFANFALISSCCDAVFWWRGGGGRPWTLKFCIIVIKVLFWKYKLRMIIWRCGNYCPISVLPVFEQNICERDGTFERNTLRAGLNMPEACSDFWLAIPTGKPKRNSQNASQLAW
jgi:hypothetical protein